MSNDFAPNALSYRLRDEQMRVIRSNDKHDGTTLVGIEYQGHFCEGNHESPSTSFADVEVKLPYATRRKLCLWHVAKILG